MIIDHEVLESGDFSQRQQVVRWIRRFPFSFLTDREYTIARRFFKQGDSYYGVTKVGQHSICSYLFVLRAPEYTASRNSRHVSGKNWASILNT